MPETAFRLNDTATYFENRGNHRKAAQLYDRALDIWRSLGWPPLGQVRRLQMNAAGCFAALGELIKAERIARLSLDQSRKSLAKDDPELVEPLLMLGILLSEQAKYSESESMLKEALSIIESGPGENHPCLPGVLGAYAELLRRMGVHPGKARRMSLRAARLRNSEGKHENCSPGLFLSAEPRLQPA